MHNLKNGNNTTTLTNIYMKHYIKQLVDRVIYEFLTMTKSNNLNTKKNIIGSSKKLSQTFNQTVGIHYTQITSTKQLVTNILRSIIIPNSSTNLTMFILLKI